MTIKVRALGICPDTKIAPGATPLFLFCGMRVVPSLGRVVVCKFPSNEQSLQIARAGTFSAHSQSGAQHDPSTTGGYVLPVRSRVKRGSRPVRAGRSPVAVENRPFSLGSPYLQAEIEVPNAMIAACELSLYFNIMRIPRPPPGGKDWSRPASVLYFDGVACRHHRT